MKQKDFSYQLIKGKIAEIIFSQMFRDAGEFTVIPFGYEQTVPELAQYVKEGMHSPVLETIRSAPDFALVSHNEQKVFLVEVKFRSHIDTHQIVEIAQKIHERWKLSWLFVASHDGFYFDSCADIIKTGISKKLSTSWIPESLQNEYLEFLNTFIQPK